MNYRAASVLALQDWGIKPNATNKVSKITGFFIKIIYGGFFGRELLGKLKKHHLANLRSVYINEGDISCRSKVA
jgi:hypothetical protein